MSDYTEKNSNLIPKIDIPCFAWNSQAEQGLLFFKAKSLQSQYHFPIQNSQAVCESLKFDKLRFHIMDKKLCFLDKSLIIIVLYKNNSS